MRPQADVQDTIISLERAALDRWITFDPDGYLAISAPEATYFDPYQAQRVDGLEALTTTLAVIKKFKGVITEPRYEMIAPKVQQHGDVALLTFNLINYVRVGDAPEAVLARWNSTEVYALVGGQWKIIHSHWSFTEPELKQAGQP